MTASASYIDWLLDVLLPVKGVTVRRMFGGAGVYCEGLMFAIIDDDRLYLKTDATGQDAFKAERQAPFTYETKNGPSQINSYWQAPDFLFDDMDELLVWVRRSIGVARQAASSPKSMPKSNPKTASAKSRAGTPRATKKREGNTRA